MKAVEHPVAGVDRPSIFQELDEWIYPAFPGWARSTPETLLFSRARVNPTARAAADLG